MDEEFAATFHPFAELFPMMPADQFGKLVEDIKKHGLIEPIIELDNQILDGRNRYLACLKAEVEPRFVEYSGSLKPLDFVVSVNLNRRHLNESQRADTASKIANMRQGERTDLTQPSEILPKVSQAEAAQMLSVSTKLVGDAAKVRKHAVPEIVQRVEAGEMPVSLAVKLIKLDEDQQREIADADIKVIRAATKTSSRNKKLDNLSARIASASKKLNGGKLYGVIYADPPWRFEPWSRDTGMDRSADNHYPTMELDAIRSLEVPASDDCVLFLWATAPMLPQALGVMSAWGFEYKSHYIWAKRARGTGYWGRNCHELLLIGVKGYIPAPQAGKQPDTVIQGEADEEARLKHSQKPSIFAALIEEMFPDVPKLEMFSRKDRPGWDHWGAEAPSDASDISQNDAEAEAA